MDKKDVVPKIARWIMEKQEFDFEVDHRSNTQMKHVDALSGIMTIVSKEDNITIKIRKMQQEDDKLKHIRMILEQQNSYDDFFMRNKVIYKFVRGRELLVVPKFMETEVIGNAHGNGHFGVRKIDEQIAQQFFIMNAKEKIIKYVGNCVHCILAERKQGKQEGFLHGIDKDELPLDTYHVDHLGPMISTVKQYKCLLIVVDAFTKFTWIYPTKRLIQTRSSVNFVYSKKCLVIHGVSLRIRVQL